MKNRSWITVLLILIILLTLLQILSANRFWIESWYSKGFYPYWAGLLTTLTGLIPFSVFEVLTGALILYLLITVIRWQVMWLRKRMSFLKASVCLFLRLATIAAGLYFWFLVSWGLNYYRIPLIDKQGQGFIRAEDKHLVTAARWATMEMIRNYEDPRFNEVEQATELTLLALDDVLSRMNEDFPGCYVRTKQFLWNYPLDASRTYGMISPFTLEAHLSSSLFPVEIPFMATHEVSHVKGYASETEGNFLAFEACLESEHPLARFSAFLTLFTYLYPTIPRTEREALIERWPAGVKEIVKQIQERDQRYAGAFLEGVKAAYDIYLKFHSHRSGIRSYSMVGSWVAVLHYSEALAALEQENVDADGTPSDDRVLGGKGPGIMKAFLEKKVLEKAASPLPKTRDEWDERRKVLYREWMRCMGLEPLPPRTPLNARVTGILRREGYRIEKIVFESRPKFPVTAHLYVPDGSEGEKLPVIFNPHGHWASKKAQPEVQTRAIFQALNGYLALVVDSPGHSFEGDALIERRSAGSHFDLRLILGSANATAVYVWDLMRALDYLETRPEADMSRVGITGTSGGGLATHAAFAAEKRFACAVPVCYPTSLEVNFYNGCECNHVPGYLQVGDRAHVLALSAPRPILVLGVDDDAEFPPEGTRLTGEKLEKIWALYGKKEDARWLIFKGQHGYFREMREAMMGFFDFYLKGKGDGSPVAEPDFLTEPVDAKELLCMQGEPENAMTMLDIAKANLATARPLPFEQVAALNGGLPPSTPLNVEILGGGKRNGTRWITYESEPGLQIPGILRLPEGEPRAAVVLVSEQGKTAACETFPVDELVKRGFACLLIDVRGFGELQGLDAKLMSYLGTGDPFAMGFDAARGVEVMLGYSPRVAVMGRGTCGAQIAMFAALMEPRTAFVAGLAGIHGYEDCFLKEVPTYSIQPRAAYSAPLPHLRSLVQQPAVWTFRGDKEPDLLELLLKQF